MVKKIKFYNVTRYAFFHLTLENVLICQILGGKLTSPLPGIPEPLYTDCLHSTPLHVASAPSLAVFRQGLQIFLFSSSYQDMTHALLLPFIATVWTPVVLAIINII